jgi:hypothetical protein
LFTRDHALPGFRRVNQSFERSASTVPGRLSIQPKQSASSTDSS